MIDKQLTTLLYDNGHGYTEIASIFKVSRQRIHQIVKNYKHHGKDGRLKKYKLLGQRCQICKQPSKTLHHIDKDNNNDSVDNLMPVCTSCHKELHKITGWSRKYNECINCLSADVSYGGKGLCKNCYSRKRYITRG